MPTVQEVETKPSESSINEVTDILEKCNFKTRSPKQLSNGDTVIIVNFNNHTLYVRNDECQEIYDRINRDILKSSEIPLPSEAEISDVVLTRYEDGGDLHRAVILSKNRKNVDVDFIDLGFTETIPVDNLYVISEELSKEDITLIPINLIGYKDGISEKASDFLSFCCDNNTTFSMKIDENSAQKLIKVEDPYKEESLMDIMQKFG